MIALKVLTFGTLFIGIIFAIVFLLLRNKNQKDVKLCTSYTEGTIVDVILESMDSIKSVDHTSTASFFPVIEYVVEGKTIKKRGFYGQAKREAFTIGEKVPMFYDPTNPEHFYLKNDPSSQKLARIFLIVSIIILTFAAIFAGILIFNQW